MCKDWFEQHAIDVLSEVTYKDAVEVFFYLFFFTNIVKEHELTIIKDFRVEVESSGWN